MDQSREDNNESCEPFSGTMTEYCKLLESWLTNAYWQRTCATSAYYTALSCMHPNHQNETNWRNNNGTPLVNNQRSSATPNQQNQQGVGNNRGPENNNNVGPPNNLPSFAIPAFRTQHMVMRGLIAFNPQF